MNRTVFCDTPNCICYPFVCFKCTICKENWWSHCHHGYPPRASCDQCYARERTLTEEALRVGVLTGKIIKESNIWWTIFAKGIHPEKECFHSNEPEESTPEVLKILCRRQEPQVPCQAPQVKARSWEAYKNRHGIARDPERYGCS